MNQIESNNISFIKQKNLSWK